MARAVLDLFTMLLLLALFAASETVARWLDRSAHWLVAWRTSRPRGDGQGSAHCSASVPAIRTPIPGSTRFVPSMQESLPPTERAPHHSRKLIRDAFTEWGFDDLIEAGELLTSELVTNVVMHAQS